MVDEKLKLVYDNLSVGKKSQLYILIGKTIMENRRASVPKSTYLSLTPDEKKLFSVITKQVMDTYGITK